jgi:hypothetical protein
MVNHPPTTDGTTQGDRPGPSAFVMELDCPLALVSSFVMGVIGLIEGLIYLTKTPEEFRAIYVDGVREWF